MNNWDRSSATDYTVPGYSPATQVQNLPYSAKWKGHVTVFFLSQRWNKLNYGIYIPDDDLSIKARLIRTVYT